MFHTCESQIDGLPITIQPDLPWHLSASKDFLPLGVHQKQPPAARCHGHEGPGATVGDHEGRAVDHVAHSQTPGDAPRNDAVEMTTMGTNEDLSAKRWAKWWC